MILEMINNKHPKVCEYKPCMKYARYRIKPFKRESHFYCEDHWEFITYQILHKDFIEKESRIAMKERMKEYTKRGNRWDNLDIEEVNHSFVDLSEATISLDGTIEGIIMNKKDFEAPQKYDAKSFLNAKYGKWEFKNERNRKS